MALNVEQMMAVSYAAVVAEARKPTDQWSDFSGLRMLEKMGCIEKIAFGENVEVPVDYRANPEAGVLANDQDAASLLNTETVTSAVFDIAQVSVPVVWTKAEEAKNPTETQKVSLVKAKLENGLNSHDDVLERAIFTTSSAGGAVELLGLDQLVPTSGAGSPGSISASTETWWANPTDTYTDATDIEAAMTDIYNQALLGSGSVLGPKFLLSGSTPHALFESVLQAQQRFVDMKEADAGFKTLMFKSLPYGFSRYGGNKIYFLNPKAFKMLHSKTYFRDKGETYPIPGQNAWYFLIYSALQNIITNKSRLAVLDAA